MDMWIYAVLGMTYFKSHELKDDINSGKYIYDESQVESQGSVNVKITEKIQGQMEGRGWSESSINRTVNNQYTTRTSTVKAEGTPATVYYNEDGSHVIVDNVTGEAIQISKIGDYDWIPDSKIVDPYIPKK